MTGPHRRACTSAAGQRRPALAALASLAALAPVSAQQIYESELHRFRLVTVAQGLEHPWSMAFLPSGEQTHRRLSRISLDGDRVMTRESLLHGELRIRDVRQGPDGYIYLAEDNRAGGRTRILRLEPAD